LQKWPNHKRTVTLWSVPEVVVHPQVATLMRGAGRITTRR